MSKPPYKVTVTRLKTIQPYNSIILWITGVTATFSQLYVVQHVHKMQSIGEITSIFNMLILLRDNAALAKVRRTKNPLFKRV